MDYWSRKARCAVGLVVALSATGASAATATWFATITGFIIDDSDFGGCMIGVSPDASVQSGTGDCPATWLSLDCAGSFNTKSQGQTKLSQAQLAYVLGKQVRVRANNQKKANGYCVGERVDLFD